jgi:hypothetical protein
MADGRWQMADLPQQDAVHVLKLSSWFETCIKAWFLNFALTQKLILHDGYAILA